jgi:hypothetical protein
MTWEPLTKQKTSCLLADQMTNHGRKLAGSRSRFSAEYRGVRGGMVGNKRGSKGLVLAT